MAEKKDEFLVPNEDYLKAGIHIGTKFKTKYMEKFIYKTRPDGLSVLNIQKIDERIRQLVNLLSYYKPEEILLVSRRENGWKPISVFAKMVGCKFFAGRYPPGLMTNPNLSTFIEAKLVFVVDSWPDRNAVKDGLRVGIPVVALCDSNNQTNGIDFVVPCNNKGKKSLGLIFYLIAKEYSKKLGLIKSDAEFKHSVEDFTAE
jgi:small subunit ribosomal protein S2